MTAKVAVVVVSYNTRDDLVACLRSLAVTGVPLETVVVDNASADGSAAAARALGGVRVMENPENAGFARAVNRGIRETTAPYVLVLNSDAQLQPGALEALARALDDEPRVGVVGPRTLNADGTVQVSFGPALGFRSEWRQRRLVQGVRNRDPKILSEVDARSRQRQEPDWISGACLLARRSALEAVGGFDERFFLYEEDVDLCRRLAAAGWRVLHLPEAEVVHRLGRSMETAAERARLEYHRSHLRYYAKHNGRAATLLLRLYLVLAGGAGWLAALGPGTGRQAQRRRSAATVAVGFEPAT